MKNIKLLLLCSALIIFLINLSACRFVVPSNKETASLGETGGFSSGAPAWAQLPKDQQVNLPANSGLIPQTFGVPEAASMSAQANASTPVGANIGRGIEMENNAIPRARQDIKVTNPRVDEVLKNEDSELGRIERQCPGTENEVIEAIKTENPESRLKKYLILTKRCPSSASLWVWLADDYLTLGRKADARKCANAALSIDPTNEKAKEILNNLANF